MAEDKDSAEPGQEYTPARQTGEQISQSFTCARGTLRENNRGETFRQCLLPEDVKGRSRLGLLPPEERRAPRDPCWSRAGEDLIVPRHS